MAAFFLCIKAFQRVGYVKEESLCIDIIENLH